MVVPPLRLLMTTLAAVVPRDTTAALRLTTNDLPHDGVGAPALEPLRGPRLSWWRGRVVVPISAPRSSR